MAIARIKSFIDNGIKSVSTPLDRTANLEPEVGVRIIHSLNEKALHVTVIGARHLPQNFGFTRVNSYVAKVKLIPGKDKFETTTRNESWPQWNEDFTFALCKETKTRFGKPKTTEEEIGGFRFVAVTLYAILEDKPLIATDKKDVGEKSKDNNQSKKESKGKESQNASGSQSTACKNGSKLLDQFFSKKVSEKKEIAKERTYDKRRTIGATTISLDSRSFVCKPVKPKHPTDLSTGELWRALKPISSGISGAEDRRECKKGQVEVSLCQEKSEKKDENGAGRLVLSMVRLRCSLQTMHEHEALKGQLYIKMSVVDGGRVTHFWKSDRFAPCISMKFSPDTARVIAENPYDGALKNVSFVVKFVSKNKMGKKTTIGHFVIGSEVGGTYGEQWKQALAKPGQQVAKWQAFE